MYSLDSLDYTILDRLQLNPFNLARISRDIKIPYHIVRRRVNRLLREYRIVRVYAEPIYPKLGLSIVVFILNKQIETNIDLKIGYGSAKTKLLGEKTMLVYTIPKKFIRDLKKFIKILYGERTVIRYGVYDKMIAGRKDFRSMDEEYIDKLDSYKTYSTLYDQEYNTPESFDQIDLYIIKELQKDATTSITDIARILHVDKQLVDYHLKRHVLARKLVVFNARVFKDMEKQPLWIFLSDFSTNNYINIIPIAEAIARLPFTSSIFLSDFSMMLITNLPTHLVLKLMQVLDRLLSRGIILDYEYYVQDPSFIPIRYTIPYRMYRNGAWRRSRILKAVRKGKMELVQEIKYISEFNQNNNRILL